MRNPARKLFRGAFGTLVFATLGFGAGQALASPAETAVVAGCSRFEAAECNGMCREMYGTGYGGSCHNDGWGNISCGCFQLVIPSES